MGADVDIDDLINDIDSYTKEIKNIKASLERQISSTNNPKRKDELKADLKNINTDIDNLDKSPIKDLKELLKDENSRNGRNIAVGDEPEKYINGIYELDTMLNNVSFQEGGDSDDIAGAFRESENGGPFPSHLDT